MAITRIVIPLIVLSVIVLPIGNSAVAQTATGSPQEQQPVPVHPEEQQPYAQPPPLLHQPQQPQPRYINQSNAHRMLMETNPEYRDARDRRLAGILVSSIGPSVGLIVGLFGALAWGLCDGFGRDAECRAERFATIGGFATAGLSLAVGIPLIVTGHMRMKEIRFEYTHLRVSADSGGARLGLSGWF